LENQLRKDCAGEKTTDNKRVGISGVSVKLRKISLQLTISPQQYAISSVDEKQQK
jgi:hypothetical protein